jgi:heptosyltransferase-3
VKVLVVRAGALGDLLLLRPVVASLREAGADVTLLAPARPGSALVGEGSGDAQRCLSWDRPEVARLFSGDPDAGSGLGSFDAVLCYSRDSALAEGLRRCSDRVLVHDPAPHAGHAAEWLARPLQTLGVRRVDPAPLLASPSERLAVRATLERLPAGFLALHPGSGALRKNWPAARFAGLARRYARGSWLLSLGPADEPLAALTREPNAVTTQDLPPRSLAALLAEAGVYVGNDSGVTHLAAACGVPTLALFGPTDPGTWAPPGAKVLRASDGTMASISLQDALGAMGLALQNEARD